MEPLCDVYVLFFLFVCFPFIHLKTSPHLPQLFRGTLQHCFTVKLQKCFADNETSPSLSISMEVVEMMTEFFFFLCVCELFL